MVDELTISLKLLFVNKNSKSAHSTGYSSVVSNKMDFGEVKASNHKMDVFVHWMPVCKHTNQHKNSPPIQNLILHIMALIVQPSKM